MDLKGFEEFLNEKNIKNKSIDEAKSIIEDFYNFIIEKEHNEKDFNYENFREYSNYLIEQNRNTFDNYIHIYRYGWYKKNNDIIIGSTEAIDGDEVIKNFSKKLKENFGEELRDEVFADIEIPPLGLDPKKKPRITKILIDRFLSKIDHEKCQKFLADGLRDKYTESYRKSRTLYLESENFDDFLKKRKENFIETLETHKNEGKLFFTQEITDKVIYYIKNNPMIESGRREDNKLYFTKIPYMTKEFLEETDKEMKKYYYCHCPWVREALKDKSKKEDIVDPIFCNCSGGYFKNYWEAVLDEPVTIDVVKSVLQGDDECQFVLNLPENIKE